MFWFGMCMLHGFTEDGDFWQFSVSSEFFRNERLRTLHSNIPLCSWMFGSPSKVDVQSSKWKGKKGEKECEWGGESGTFTPSCQFSCGPLSPHYPALVLLHRPPSSVLMFGFQTVKSKPGQAVSPGMKDSRGSEEGMRKTRLGKTWGWKCEGAWRDFIRYTGDGALLKYLSSTKISTPSVGFQDINAKIHFTRTERCFLLHHKFFLFH